MSDKKLTEVFTSQVIEQLKANKDLITFELLQTIRSYGNEGKDLALEILDTEKDEEGYYLDAFNNRISLDGNRLLKKAYTKMKLCKIHFEEIERCKKDIKYFRDNYLKIRTNKGIGFPEVRQYQNEFIDKILDDNNEAIVSVQGRQSGKSVTTANYLEWEFNFNENIDIGIVANKGETARDFLNKVSQMFTYLPMWMKQGVVTWNKGSIVTESNVRILTDVPSENAFRGKTVAILVVDEVAFIKSSIWNIFADSIFPAQSALSWKKNIMISTPKGMNHFYDLVEKAKSGIDGFAYHEVYWKDVPRYDSKGNRLDPEKFREKIIAKNGLTHWLQNYECSFIGSSNTLVKSDTLKSFTSKIPLYKQDDKLNVYYEPEENHKYIMAVDPSRGGGDAFAVQIVDVTNKPFIQVASAQLFDVNYYQMPMFLDEWARDYNNAFLIIENNEGAGTYINAIIQNEIGYENLYADTDNKGKPCKESGFKTTSKTRQQILDTLKMFLDDNLLILNDKASIDEQFTFILKNNKYQADDDCHDDMVMSLALIFAPFCNSRNFEEMQKVIDGLYSEVSDFDFASHLTIGDFSTVIDDSNYMEFKRDGFY